jgi:sugar O-acyltransferase (sialic acid O-acetyltransferase NeuD family)
MEATTHANWTTLIVHGASGHGRVVADAALCMLPALLILGTDDASSVHGKPWFGQSPCTAPPSPLPHAGSGTAIHIAVGANATRERVAQRMNVSDQRIEWASIIHPQAVVSDSSVVGRGVLIAALAVVAPSVRVGDGVIVNHASVVDHDVVLGAFCHIAPGAVLGGAVRIGARALIGARAVVLPGVSICDDAVIGAGAVVTRDVTRAGIWVGVPAREQTHEH